MLSYIAQPCSRLGLRNYTLTIRRRLGIENNFYFPVVEFLELMSEFFPKFHFEVTENHELPLGVHADMDAAAHLIRVKQNVYDGACVGNGRDRMTIAHEIGHYMTLCVLGFRLQRNFSNAPVKTYQDPEWQAKCFAGELLIPYHLVRRLNPAEISRLCGVSFEAAEIGRLSNNASVATGIATDASSGCAKVGAYNNTIVAHPFHKVNSF